MHIINHIIPFVTENNLQVTGRKQFYYYWLDLHRKIYWLSCSISLYGSYYAKQLMFGLDDTQDGCRKIKNMTQVIKKHFLRTTNNSEFTKILHKLWLITVCKEQCDLLQFFIW